jgi:AcrR family transcriptional regulator
VSDVKRKYSSPVRDEQAARTRERILDAAAALFLDRGYGRTTMKDIADRAGVARDTVHAVFGGKAKVLTALIDARLVPDGSVTNVTQRPDVQTIKDEPDQRTQIERFARFIAETSTELRPVFEILRTASAIEPAMATVFAEMDRYRLLNMSSRKAAEIIWTLASPDVARMLCDELGWTQAQHARWLGDTLARTLLPDR